MAPALKILVVDDEQNMCTFLSKLLNDEGYEITTVKNGDRAIEEVRKGSFDLILLDIIMPGMDGLETYKEIKKIDPKIPTIMINHDYSVKGLIDQAKLEGVRTCLNEPFNATEIITTVEEILEVKKELWNEED